MAREMVLTQCDLCQIDFMVLLPLAESVMSPATSQSLSFQQDLVSTNEANGTVPALPVCVLLYLLDKLGEVVSERYVRSGLRL
jgi:hypothetical protein